MKVEEKVGKSSGVGEKAPMATKTKWIILFSGFGVLIVGLVIAIVVVVVTRGGTDDLQATNTDEYNKALGIYYEDNEEIATAVVEQKLDGEAMLKMLKEKIDIANNEMAKAMLEQDYYMTMFSTYGPDESKKDEILNGLIKTYEVLRDLKSAESVANIALAYYDFELYQQYTDIAKTINPDYQSIYDFVEGTGE